MNKLPPSLEAKREKLAKDHFLVVREHSNLEANPISVFSYLEGFNAGANAVLDSEELKGLVEAYEQTYWSSWQSTAEIDAAMKKWQELLKEQDEKCCL